MTLLDYKTPAVQSGASAAAIALYVGAGVLPLLWIPAQWYYEVTGPITRRSDLWTVFALCGVAVSGWIIWAGILWWWAKNRRKWLALSVGLAWMATNVLWVGRLVQSVLQEPSVRWLLS
jgi:hypothetical protein